MSTRIVSTCIIEHSLKKKEEQKERKSCIFSYLHEIFKGVFFFVTIIGSQQSCVRGAGHIRQGESDSDSLTVLSFTFSKHATRRPYSDSSYVQQHFDSRSLITQSHKELIQFICLGSYIYLSFGMRFTSSSKQYFTLLLLDLRSSQ